MTATGSRSYGIATASLVEARAGRNCGRDMMKVVEPASSPQRSQPTSGALIAIDIAGSAATMRMLPDRAKCSERIDTRDRI